MKARGLIALVLTGLIAGALIAPTAATAAAPASVKVATDAVGDWGTNVDPSLGALGDPLGMDLTAASISGTSKLLNFVISVNSLPASGGVPEVSRYTWDFMVNGKYTELDGKFTNYSRGVCDPTSGQCPPPRDPGMQPFFVRGDCALVEGTNVQTCKELGVIQATFDAAKGTITIPVPGSLIGAKRGSKITGGTNIFGGSISATPAAFLSSGNGPYDIMVVGKTFIVR